MTQLVLMEAHQDHREKQGEEEGMEPEEDGVGAELELQREVLLEAMEEGSPGEERLTRLTKQEPPAEREMRRHERRIEIRGSTQQADRLRLVVGIPRHQSAAIGKPCLAGHGQLLGLRLLLEPLVEVSEGGQRALVGPSR